ncbi:GIY-YIG catalytic domain-containing endonuclease [Acanthocystis turfacea Chlorella virus NE-JV-3]|nr:GIY-YIG catalytic domain-containing endonuclease [Acanthocystis turfacea Chlorella virus NE-JV-3]
MGFIYMLTSPYGKSYIGQTVRPIEERFKNHQKPSSGCVAIYNAIQKYGWEKFEKHWYEVPDEDLNDHEELMVEVLGTLAPGGYNLKEGGGSGGKWCEEVKKKISKTHAGKTLSDDHRKKIGTAQLGRTLSDDHKQNISDAKKGKTHTDDAKQNMSDAHKGEKNSLSKKVYQYELDGTFVQSFASSGEAARSLNKISGSSIRACANGERNSAYGFKWSFTELF